MCLLVGLGLGLLWTIKKIYTRINLVEGGWWVVKEQQDLERRKEKLSDFD
jgi:hypothetical protein